MRIGAERVAGNRLARGVQLEQLFGHVAHGLLDAGLRALPRRAAELVERRLRRAAVLLDEVEPLDGNEQLVFAEVAQLHEFLHGVADADLFEPDEPPDAVVDMHDQIVDLEIAQVRQEGLGDGSVPVALALDLGPLFFEDVRLGNDLQLGARQTEALRELPDGDVHGDVSSSSVRSISTPRSPYSVSSSAVRSARPSVPATNSTVSPRSRMRLTSAIHSWMRPRNSTAG